MNPTMTNSHHDTASNQSLRCSRGDFLKTGALLGAATLLPTCDARRARVDNRKLALE